MLLAPASLFNRRVRIGLRVIMDVQTSRGTPLNNYTPARIGDRHVPTTDRRNSVDRMNSYIDEYGLAVRSDHLVFGGFLLEERRRIIRPGSVTIPLK